jgi:hypothetical protein
MAQPTRNLRPHLMVHVERQHQGNFRPISRSFLTNSGSPSS